MQNIHSIIQILNWEFFSFRFNISGHQQSGYSNVIYPGKPSGAGSQRRVMWVFHETKNTRKDVIRVLQGGKSHLNAFKQDPLLSFLQNTPCKTAKNSLMPRFQKITKSCLNKLWERIFSLCGISSKFVPRSRNSGTGSGCKSWPWDEIKGQFSVVPCHDI